MKTNSCSSKRLEVFDFDEDDKAVLVTNKYSTNCNSSNAIDKYSFLQNVAQEKNMELKEIGNIRCVDVDTTSSYHDGDFTASVVSLDEGKDCAVGKTSNLDTVAPQIGSNIAEEHPQFGPNKFGPRSSCSQMEEEIFSPKVASPANINLKSPRLKSSSSSDDESNDAVPDTDERMSERSPSTSSNTKEDHCFGSWQMVDGDSVIECFPDYILCRDKYSTSSVITFSSSYIEIKDSNGTSVFRWGVDDIINIESQSFERYELVVVKICVVSKGTIPIEDVHGSSVIEELKFAIVDEDWYETQEAIISLGVYRPLWNILPNPGMDGEEESLLGPNGVSSSKHYFPVFDETFEDVIYPKGDPDAVSISKRDIDLLQPDTFVNDTIIDFYIKYLKNKMEPGERHRFHFFNSFFFRKLADPDKNSLSATEGRAAYQRVRKWTRKINLFEKDFLFIPVNFNYHWSLVVICHPGEVAQFQEADASKSLKVPCILHMDSMKGSHSGLKGLLQSYLLEEWKERQKDTSEEISSRFLNLRLLSLELPQQPNLFDCGLFLLHYVELFLEGIPDNFNPFKIHKFSNFLTVNWFQPAEACLKRTSIERLIYDLLDEGSHGNSSDSENDKNCPKSVGENGTTEEFGSERRSPKRSFHMNVQTSQAGEGLELTLLPTSSPKSSQHASDSGLVLRELFDPGAGVGSFYQPFEQSAPFDGFKIAASPVEGEEETDGHFGYSHAGAETGLDRLAAITSELIGEPSWNPGTTHEDIDSLPETSIHASAEPLKVDEMNNDGEIGTNLSLEVKLDQTMSPVTGNVPKEMHDPNSQNNADHVTPCPTQENGTGTCEVVQSIYDDSVSEHEDLQHPIKKRRLTPLEGEGGEGIAPRSLAEDLHL